MHFVEDITVDVHVRLLKATNHSSNEDRDLHSPEGNVICTWVGGAGSDISVYGGSKAPGMP